MPATTPSDHEVTANKLAVDTAQHTSTATSLAAQFGLGDSSDDGDASNNGPSRLEAQELQLRDFGVLGIGYTPPVPSDADGPSPGTDSAATARLRRQLLGKNASMSRAGPSQQRAGAKFVASKPRPDAARKRGNDDRGEEDDEEEGRSTAMGGKQNRMQRAGIGRSAAAAAALEQRTIAATAPAADETTAEHAVAPTAIAGDPAPAAPVAAAPSKKRSGTSSYLDQLLAERAAKKSKKRKKNKQNPCNGGEQIS